MDQHILTLRKNLEYKNSEALLEKLKVLKFWDFIDKTVPRIFKDMEMLKHKMWPIKSNMILLLKKSNKNSNLLSYKEESAISKKFLAIPVLKNFYKEIILWIIDSNDLSENIKKLKNTTELLSENSLDSLFGRISYVNQQLDRLGNKKAQVSLEGSKLSKVIIV